MVFRRISNFSLNIVSISVKFRKTVFRPSIIIDVCPKIKGLILEYKYIYYGLLDALRAHGCAYMKASQSLTEKSINEKLENSSLNYKFLLLD